jgi:TonB family protein
VDIVTINAGWAGHVIDGRFPLLQWLGGSDRSCAFLTELNGPGSPKAAIKLTLANYASAQAQMLRWAEAAKISHPHLMRLLHTGRTQVETTGVVYSVTEYAEEVLADVLNERPLRPEETKEMLLPVLDALFYVHGKGYVHGSLKPSNVLVVRNQIRLSADGLQVAGEPGRRFRALTAYDAPESGEAMMAPPADVWSLGMMLAAALTQHTPEWERESGKEPVVPAEIPQPFARMVRECLRLNPTQRCTLADVNKARFEQVRTDDDLLGRRRSADEEDDDDDDDEEREGSRRGLIAAVAVVVLLAIFAVVHWWPAPGKSPAKAPVATAAQSTGNTGAAGAVKTSPEARPAKHEKAAAKAEMEKPLAGVPEAASTQSEGTTAAPVSAPSGEAAAAGSGAVATGKVAERMMPQAPQDALDTIHGTVRVRVKLAVDASGNVTGATFADAGPSKYFARLAMDAAQKWRFAPGAEGERVVEFDFQRTGVAAGLAK